MSKILTAETTETTKKYRLPAGVTTIQGWGTWGTGEINCQIAPDDGTGEDYEVGSEVDEPDGLLTFTSNFVKNITISKSFWLVVTTSGAGFTLNLEAF